MRISNCITSDAVDDAIHRLTKDTPAKRMELRSATPEKRSEFLRNAGCMIMAGSDCSDHPTDGVTIIKY